MEEAETNYLKGYKDWSMLFSINRWICIQRQDGYALSEDKRDSIQNSDQNSFAQGEDNTKWWSKLSFWVVLASSVGDCTQWQLILEYSSTWKKKKK